MEMPKGNVAIVSMSFSPDNFSRWIDVHMKKEENNFRKPNDNFLPQRTEYQYMYFVFSISSSLVFFFLDLVGLPQ